MSSPDDDFPVLIGDIGGTNARFEVQEHRNAPPKGPYLVKTRDFDTPETAIEASVLSKVQNKPVRAILAAAGPITDQGLDLTNNNWAIRPERFLESGSFRSLILMNDFEAQALSLPFLQPGDLSSLGGPEAADDIRTKAVIGPGTGLGVGALVRAAGKWIPVPGEGGHVDLGPRKPREESIWHHLEPIEGRISAEQLLSGDGLKNLYSAICLQDSLAIVHDTAAQISTAALDNADGTAVEALTLFCTCLGRVAGDLALTTMAQGGVYIAGGIGTRILPFLQKSGFRAAFEDKAPHRDLISSIGTCVITHPLPALMGLAAYASSPNDFAVDIEHRNWCAKQA